MANVLHLQKWSKNIFEKIENLLRKEAQILRYLKRALDCEFIVDYWSGGYVRKVCICKILM